MNTTAPYNYHHDNDTTATTQISIIPCFRRILRPIISSCGSCLFTIVTNLSSSSSSSLSSHFSLPSQQQQQQHLQPQPSFTAIAGALQSIMTMMQQHLQQLQQPRPWFHKKCIITKYGPYIIVLLFYLLIRQWTSSSDPSATTRTNFPKNHQKYHQIINSDTERITLNTYRDTMLHHQLNDNNPNNNDANDEENPHRNSQQIVGATFYPSISSSSLLKNHDDQQKNDETNVKMISNDNHHQEVINNQITIHTSVLPDDPPDDLMALPSSIPTNHDNMNHNHNNKNENDHDSNNDDVTPLRNAKAWKDFQLRVQTLQQQIRHVK